MFCDANPERDLNRIVAGSKKKSVVVKVVCLTTPHTYFIVINVPLIILVLYASPRTVV